jgi:arylsulfatase A-like enzyme
MGDWKAVRSGPNKPVELYNLKDDPAEKNDLASSQPDVLAKAEALMKAAHTDSPDWPTTLGAGAANQPAGAGKGKAAKKK